MNRTTAVMFFVGAMLGLAGGSSIAKYEFGQKLEAGFFDWKGVPYHAERIQHD